MFLEGGLLRCVSLLRSVWSRLAAVANDGSSGHNMKRSSNMEIRRVPVSKLNPAAYNPRKNLQPGDPEYKKLARSLDKFGCVEPIVWNEYTGNVVGGHQRLKVLVAAGETELDVSVVNLSDADEKALNIALNKIAGEWDTTALTELLQELSADSSIDETLTGFDRGELDNLLADLEGRTQEAAPSGVDPYVDGFFESGVQTKEPQKAPNPGEGEGISADSQWSVIISDLTAEDMETLTAFLDSEGFAYRTQIGGVV